MNIINYIKNRVARKPVIDANEQELLDKLTTIINNTDTTIRVINDRVGSKKTCICDDNVKRELIVVFDVVDTDIGDCWYTLMIDNNKNYYFDDNSRTTRCTFNEFISQLPDGILDSPKFSEAVNEINKFIK